MDQDFLEHADLQIRHNNKEHRTDEIDTNRLIVRRGQAFKIRLEFRSGHVDKYAGNLHFVVEPGNPHLQQYAKKVSFTLSSEDTRNNWSASVVKKNSKSMEISILPPPNAITGLHVLKVQTSETLNSGLFLGKFIILFNPWCTDDAVFLELEEERNEYVMNENGFVYLGNADWISQRSWNFGQFDKDIIDICLQLLDRSHNNLQDPLSDYTRRNDPVYVSRIISAMINSNDDNGVIQGRWDDNYENGTCPTKWNGSNAILRQWSNSGFKPVKYGQCWVFASILCTVMRCLGIPTRVVTNFDSAHDTDGNLFIDEYYDIMGKMIEKDTRDSIWNFHVWNECWMQRRDLPYGYNGWQVLDATPQERSNGIFCCGPTSVKAIKEGAVHLDYDGSFVFAEVNADVISWLVKISSPKKEKIFQNSKRVGRRISTKSVWNDSRVDITSNYKYDEGSEMERKTFQRALEMMKSTDSRVVNNSRLTLSEVDGTDNSSPPAPPGFRLKLKVLESAVFGQDIHIAVLSSNQTSQKKKLSISLTVQAMENNGRPGRLVLQKTSSIELSPKADVKTEYWIPYLTYKKHITHSNLLNASVVGELNDTHEKLLAERKITLENPSLDIEVNGPVILDKPCIVRTTFKNTLPEDIHNSILKLEGSGLIHRQITIQLGTIKIGHTLRIQSEITPFKPGSRNLQALFTSDQIKSITGYKDVTVISRHY
ncbi:protein-glutamine gamma-glutamyltransferase 5-like [Spea bombifrons]|uniref:protein-glutamine gamma-glutamyltransferase 5-like n=1 Tax=Spea bombifrons TaxID=233779 RepID=UPI00234B6BC7|nr:protein-glutamine gamma-glutamyltransferase 5-like [Spea bombifrons]